MRRGNSPYGLSPWDRALPPFPALFSPPSRSENPDRMRFFPCALVGTSLPYKGASPPRVPLKTPRAFSRRSETAASKGNRFFPRPLMARSGTPLDWETKTVFSLCTLPSPLGPGLWRIRHYSRTLSETKAHLLFSPRFLPCGSKIAIPNSGRSLLHPHARSLVSTPFRKIACPLNASLHVHPPRGTAL